MSYAEREALAGLITSLIVIGLFLWQLSGQQAAGAFDGPDALQLWARAVLVLIGWSIGIAIVVNVAFAILHPLLTGEKSDDRRDERDRTGPGICCPSGFWPSSSALLSATPPSMR